MPESENASDAAALSVVADELYAVPADDFVSVRTDRARQLRGDGRRDLAAAVAGLPKPTVAAWLLNQLARQRPDATRQLVELGDELREAQRTLDGPDLRALTRQRQAVVAAYVRQVRALAEQMDRRISADVALQIEETLRAAVADAAAGEALLSGRLTTGLSYAGLGEVDVSAAVAAPRPAPAPAPRRKKQAHQPEPADDELAAARRRRAEEARQELAAAEGALAEAEAERVAAKRAVDDLATRSAEADARVEAVRAELERIESAAAALAQELLEAEHRCQEATTVAVSAEQAVQTARMELGGTS